MPSMDSRRAPMVIDDNNKEVIWTYDVRWKHSDIEWASRWDIYLSMAGRYDDEVHWFAISSALLIVLFLGGIVALMGHEWMGQTAPTAMPRGIAACMLLAGRAPAAIPR